MIRVVRPLVLLLMIVALLSGPSVFAQAVKTEKPVVHFGIIPRYNPMIMYHSYQPMMDYLTQNTPYRFELKLSRDYTETIKFLQSGETPVTSLGGVTCIEAQQAVLHQHHHRAQRQPDPDGAGVAGEELRLQQSSFDLR
jgi:ABC-type phosphate/phosphonate transport system substrate-binding protein